MDAEGLADLLQEIEAYYDAVPRAAARVEQIGPFTLFVKTAAGWPYYARPTLGATRFSAADVARVRARQRELALPETFEWVAETSPHLRVAAEAAGLAVAEHPLMTLQAAVPPRLSAPGVEVRLVGHRDDLTLLSAIPRVAFAAPGTATGPQGSAEARAVAAGLDPATAEFTRERLRSGRTVMAVALVAGRPVGIGSHQPVGAVSEVVGVGVLPAFRRRGIAAALTGLLAADARERGVRTVFLSAGDDVIGRVYQRAGFRRVATACTAEPAEEA